MARFLAPLLPLLVLSSAYAAEDAPMPETVNWTGIIIFLVILVGGCVGFLWRLLRNETKTKK